MPAKGSGTWPNPGPELRDRYRIVELVRAVGERQLTFTVYDVKKVASENARWKLEVPSQLARHVAALAEEGVVECVARRITRGPAATGATRARKKYILAHRKPELATAPPALSDVERVHLAYWVARDFLEQEAVPTRAVTQVLREVPDLALSTPRNTQNHLVTLSTGAQPLLGAVKGESRWTTWVSYGGRPDHDNFEKWVRQYRAAVERSPHAVVATGHASVSRLIQDLVAIAVQSTVSSTWPQGRSVSVGDIRATVADMPEARRLHDELVRRGSSIGKALGDATKERIAGMTRVERIIVKFTSGFGSGSFYDVDIIQGLEIRSLYVSYKAMNKEAKKFKLEEIVRDAKFAASLAVRAHPVLSAIGAVRQVLAHDELDRVEVLVKRLREHARFLSKTVRKVLDAREADLKQARAAMGLKEAAWNSAINATQRIDVDLNAILCTPRRLLLPTDYAAFFPVSRLRGKTPPEFMSLKRALRRFDNPDFKFTSSQNVHEAACYAVDRADALMHAAELHMGRVAALLRAGTRILGRNYRDRVLPRMLACDDHRDQRIAGLGALVLLGDQHAVEVALRLLSAEGARDEKEYALHALLVMKQVNPADWPATIRDDPSLRPKLTEIVVAARTNRWLLQR